MEYKKFSDSRSSILWIISLMISIISLVLCGGLMYKIYNLQLQIVELDLKHLYLQKDFLEILKQSDEFQWTTGTSDDYQYDYENDSEYSELQFKPIEQNSTENKEQLLNSDNQRIKLRLKRELLRRTFDGVPVNSESYEDAKKNKSSKTAPTSPGTYVRQSRVMRVEDKSKVFRRLIKKPILKSADLVLEDDQNRQIRRKHRQRRVDSGERYSKLKPAIHLSGDVYVSNGLAHHEAEHYKNWSRESWVKALGMDQYFLLENGYLKISEPGLYLIYAQVLYFDEHDTNGFYVYKNDEIILQCTTTSHSTHHVRKSNTCYTAGINHLNEGDRLRVHDIESYRYSIFRPGKSFFGAIKLSDVRKVH
ncbi:uncharacterized protein [Onthophagus taurus]|uniref:uncharacterized protein n=1 Tax=Onthophagus taurus TaxID=166361 RepID=UPI000C20CE49|nr:uncharacterized protein LOC111425583 [Onthophagus taurus]